MKRLFGMLVVTLAVVGLALTLHAGTASAARTTTLAQCVPAASKSSGQSCDGTPCEPKQFLTLIPWYQYLTLHSEASNQYSFCEPIFTLLPNGSQPSSLPLVLLAVLEDMVRIAGLAAVAYVIWGGIKYITSQGSPDGTKQAQQTIINALIGLVIAMIATGAVSYFGHKLAGS